MGKRLTWGNARTLLDLGELVARWLEGRLQKTPWYDFPPDEETEAIAEWLARLNRAGLVTDGSQPGMSLDSYGCAQRAFLTAYTSEVVAKRVAALSLYTDLIVFFFEPGGAGGYMVPVTVAEFHPCTWAGSCFGEVAVEDFGRDLSIAVRDELRAAWEVTVIDPVWGRKSYLWEAVVGAVASPGPEELRWSIRPYDPESPEIEFCR